MMMKKSIAMIAACVSIALLHGMEEQRRIKVTCVGVCSAAKSSKKIVFNICGTELQIIKGSIVNANKKVDFIVLDRSEQRRLQEPSLGDGNRVGDFESADNIIYCKNSDDESGSEDDTYRYYGTDFYQKMWKNAIAHKIDTKVALVVGPRIGQGIDYVSGKGRILVPWYCVTKKDEFKEDRYHTVDEKGDEAIAAALADLRWCTNKILTAGITKNYKKIAMVALGVEVGIERNKATPVIASVIIDFVKNNVIGYEKILLYVKKSSEFLQYSELFAKAIMQK